MTEVEQRVSRLEGAYGHLATKEDIQALNAALTRQMGAMEKEIGTLKGEIGKLKGGATAVAVVIGAVLALLQVVLKFAIP